MRSAVSVVVALSVLSCGRDGFDDKTEPVSAAFPFHADWNSYIARVDGPVWTAADVDCDPTSAACLHGGELRRYDVEQQATCNGLTAHDDLDAFVWSCDATSGHAVFYSVSLRSDARLADLLDENGFFTNAVTVSQAGRSVARSLSTTWWGNPVLMLPDDEPTGQLDTALAIPGAVYVATHDATRGYRIAAERIAVVVPRGRSLTLADGGGSQCTSVPGPPAGTRCILKIDGQRFTWVEGRFELAGESGIPLGVIDASFARLRHVETQRGRYGMLLSAVHAVDVMHYRTAQNFRYGVIVYGGDNVRLTDTTFGTVGVDNGAAAFLIDNAARNISVVQTLIDGARPFGFLIQDVAGVFERGITIAFATIVNGTESGISANGVIGLTVTQSIIANRSGPAVGLGAQTSATISQLVATSDTVTTQLSADATCNFIPPGVIDDVDPSLGFVGATSTTSDFAALTDFVDSSPYRTWNADVPSFPSPGLYAGCSSGACRLWDWRIANGGVASRNGALTPGAACPALPAVTDGQGNTFLVNALEALDDGGGDDDGLCESGESCIFAPHIGAYLGEGELTAPCIYAGSEVPGVTLRAYSQALAL